MLRLLVIIAFIYILYFIIKYIIRRAQVSAGHQFDSRFRNSANHRQASSRNSRFDNIQEAEYEEVDDTDNEEKSASGS